MSWKRTKDLKAFIWYLLTEPGRRIKNEIRAAFYDTKRDVTNLKQWAEFFLILSIFSIILNKMDFVWMFFALFIILRVYYEWRSKRYRHLWKRHHPEERYKGD